jgi:hypothetical protein
MTYTPLRGGLRWNSPGVCPDCGYRVRLHGHALSCPRARCGQCGRHPSDHHWRCPAYKPGPLAQEARTGGATIASRIIGRPEPAPDDPCPWHPSERWGGCRGCAEAADRDDFPFDEL